MTKEQLAKHIEQTLLKPEATYSDIEKLCDEAMKYNFYGVCVAPKYVEFVKEKLASTDIKVISVVGFPLGTSMPEVKSLEAMLLQQAGADEIDMVLNYSALIEGDLERTYNEIMQVVHDVKIPVKVILETSKLTNEQIVSACELCVQAGAKFVKTSTGFMGGATKEAVEVMSSAVAGRIKIKASGGIRDLNTALMYISAGADRIGTSSGAKIIDEFKNEK